ncbi:MAG: hypothetical protein U9Q67_00480, partial [Patescibacteria group bacterium]|nr:hypothetical protein [Patescibacteria group bacterium]
KWTANVSGERILYKKNILPYLDIISTAGYGIEQISNYAHRNLKVKIIEQEDIGHLLKFHNRTPWQWSWDYIHEGWQILRTAITLWRLTPQLPD